VTSVHVPLAGTGAGSAAAMTHRKLVRTLKATVKVLTILCISNPNAKWDRSLRTGAPSSGARPLDRSTQDWRPLPNVTRSSGRACRMAFRPVSCPKKWYTNSC
jgi:hypothetical protein